jgi:hypothetical protein
MYVFSKLSDINYRFEFFLLFTKNRKKIVLKIESIPNKGCAKFGCWQLILLTHLNLNKKLKT